MSALLPYTQVHTHACMYPHTYLNLHTYAYTSTVSMQKKKKILLLTEVFNKLRDKVGSEALRQVLKMCL